MSFKTAESFRSPNQTFSGANMPCTTNTTCPSCQTTITENDLGYFRDNNQNFVCEDCFNEKFITEQYKQAISNGLLSLIEKMDSGLDNHQAICEVVPEYGLNTHQTSMVIWEYNKMQIAKHKASENTTK